ncbi:MAG: right-handed parallel beta-helix repeat-containing protein [Chromatiaceae bacterium]|nr:right-handed parallel beta-helix repeat-containing protein [Chromatiaceae bacterium]
MTVASGVTLAIEPGTTIALAANVGLVVQGRLDAQGTEEAPITFDPIDGAGDPWSGVRFASNADDSRIRHAWISGADTCVEVDGGIPLISDSVLTGCADYGVRVDGGAPTLEHNLIVENGGHGIYVYRSASPRIRYNTIDLNGQDGLSLDSFHNDADTLIENNLITRNGRTGWHNGSSVTRGYNNVWGNGTDYGSAGTLPDSHISSDPLYVDPDNGNWLLRTGSPSLTAGSDGGQIGRYGGRLSDDEGPVDGCSTSALTLSEAITAGSSQDYRSEHSISVAGTVSVASSAALSLTAPRITFSPGFQVSRGGQLSATAAAVTCPVESPTITSSATEPAVIANRSQGETRVAKGDVVFIDAPKLASDIAALPVWLQDRLIQLGVNPDAFGSSLLGADGHWLIFETNQTLQTSDRNDASDLYRLDLLSDQLQLISANAQGQAGNGPSHYPAADATGELIVFHSEAGDLVPSDHNGVSDLFLHDLAHGQTTRLTDAEEASAHPTIDAQGTILVYDQRTQEGPRQVLGQALADGAVTEVLSLPATGDGAKIDNHHPAISADGRFVVYLEQDVSGAAVACHVHLYDRASQVYHRQPCPTALAESSEFARPRFSDESDQILWFLPAPAQPIMLRNPLH